jgi:hypothetical protein
MNPGPSAILGNGSLLATMSARSDVERLFWPTLDRGSHLGELSFNLGLNGRSISRTSSRERPLTRSGELELVDLVRSSSPCCCAAFAAGRERQPVVECRPELDGVGRLAANVAAQPRGLLPARRRWRGTVGAEAFATGSARPRA